MQPWYSQHHLNAAVQFIVSQGLVIAAVVDGQNTSGDALIQPGQDRDRIRQDESQRQDYQKIFAYIGLHFLFRV
jgi:hypothetical protein